MATIHVRDDPDNERYVAEIGDEVVAYTVYHLRHGNLYFFPHTQVEQGYSGQGIAETLVRSALDDVESKGGKIVPLCPYIAGFLRKNPEYDDLVDHEVFDRIAERLHPE